MPHEHSKGPLKQTLKSDVRGDAPALGHIQYCCDALVSPETVWLPGRYTRPSRDPRWQEYQLPAIRTICLNRVWMLAQLDELASWKLRRSSLQSGRQVINRLSRRKCHEHIHSHTADVVTVDGLQNACLLAIAMPSPRQSGSTATACAADHAADQAGFSRARAELKDLKLTKRQWTRSSVSACLRRSSPLL
jgi:hypothetical protein